jgi:hypothetical protein
MRHARVIEKKNRIQRRNNNNGTLTHQFLYICIKNVTIHTTIHDDTVQP